MQVKCAYEYNPNSRTVATVKEVGRNSHQTEWSANLGLVLGKYTGAFPITPLYTPLFPKYVGDNWKGASQLLYQSSLYCPWGNFVLRLKPTSTFGRSVPRTRRIIEFLQTGWATLPRNPESGQNFFLAIQAIWTTKVFLNAGRGYGHRGRDPRGAVVARNLFRRLSRQFRERRYFWRVHLSADLVSPGKKCIIS
jgi:hypothetical protein